MRRCREKPLIDAWVLLHTAVYVVHIIHCCEQANATYEKKRDCNLVFCVSMQRGTAPYRRGQI